MSAAVACPHRARRRPAYGGSGQAAGGLQAAARPGAEAYAARDSRPGAGAASGGATRGGGYYSGWLAGGRVGGLASALADGRVCGRAGPGRVIEGR